MWGFCYEEKALWRHVISAIYGVDNCGWNFLVPRDKRNSKLWARITKQKSNFKFTKFLVGDGMGGRLDFEKIRRPQPLVSCTKILLPLVLKRDWWTPIAGWTQTKCGIWRFLIEKWAAPLLSFQKPLEMYYPSSCVPLERKK